MKSGVYQRYGKRVLDSVAAAIGLLLLSPILVVVAVLAKITSPGPVLYQQERVGKGGRVFRIIKFRSMFEDADKCGLSITFSEDPRVTTLGRWLRWMKLDELPQLWNVLKGDMSFVGPRPEVPHYVQSYSPSQLGVLSVRPGITDPASITYRSEEELLCAQSDPDRYYREVILPHKLTMNLEYLDRMSLLYDLSLVLRTTGSVFTPLWKSR